MNFFKRLYLAAYRQLHARKNLYQLRDRRALQLRLSPTLSDAAQVWPEVLPYAPRTVLDVGAHRGDMAAQLAELYRPAFIGLVEPLPAMAALLEAKRFAPAQKVFACALGRERGTGTLNVLASAPSSSLLSVTPASSALFQKPMHTTESIAVPLRTLDDIFAECGLETLDLLKLDVQGYELEVLAGGAHVLPKTRLVVCEVSFFEHYAAQPLFHDVYSYLHAYDFELRGLFGWAYDAGGLPLQCDAVFINRVMHT